MARVSVARSETIPRDGNSYDKDIAQGEPVGEGVARVIYFVQAKYITRVFISANTVRTNEHVMVVLAELASR